MPYADQRNVEANAVVVGPPGNTGVLQSVAMTSGQILVGKTGYPPAATTLDSSDGSLVVTTGPGTIDVTVAPSVRKCVITLSCGATNISTNPSYYSAADASTGDFASALVFTPYKGIARHLSVSRNGFPATTPTDTLRYYDGTSVVDSALAVTFPSGANAVVLGTGSTEVVLDAGWPIEMKSTETSATRHAATFEFEEVPP